MGAAYYCDLKKQISKNTEGLEREGNNVNEIETGRERQRNLRN